jgi:hypothetical protein
MEIGQSVFVQKSECNFNHWYEAHIVDIGMSQRPVYKGCCSSTRVVPLLYVVRYSDDSTQVVPLNRIVERL